MERISLAILTLLAFLVRLMRSLEVPYPLGTDGYYYVVQVESLLAQGRLHVPDASWVHPWLACAAGLVGDPVFGVKVGSALLAAACVPAAYALGQALGNNRTCGWLLAAWAAASPTLTLLGADFLKNLGVAAPFLGLLALFALGWGRPSRWRGAWWRPATLVVLALLVAIAHRTGAALLLVGGVGWGLGWLGARFGRGTTQRAEPRSLALGALVVLACFALFAIGSALLPAWLHPSDLERLQGRFALEPHWPAPWGWLQLRPIHAAHWLELSLPWVVVVALAPAWFLRRDLRPWLAGLGLPLLVFVFPGWRLDELDLGYRLSLLAPLVAMPLFVVLLARHSGSWPPLMPRVLRLAALVLVLAARTGVDPHTTPPYERYGIAVAKIPRPLPSLLIAHQGMSFYYDHLTGHEAMAWSPEPDLDRLDVGRVVWGVRSGEWLAFAPSDLDAPRPLPLGFGYHYVREDLWETFLERAQAEGDDDLQVRVQDWRNPRRVRPASLLRNR